MKGSKSNTTRISHYFLKPAFHLTCCCPGKSDHQDLTSIYPTMLQHIFHPVRDHRRFPLPGPARTSIGPFSCRIASNCSLLNCCFSSNRSSLQQKREQDGYNHLSVLFLFPVIKFCCSSSLSDYLPQHFLYFLPLPQGHGSFLPTFGGFTSVLDVFSFL